MKITGNRTVAPGAISAGKGKSSSVNALPRTFMEEITRVPLPVFESWKEKELESPSWTLPNPCAQGSHCNCWAQTGVNPQNTHAITNRGRHRMNHSSQALRTRPPGSPVPARWAPTWHPERVAWPLSVPLHSVLTSFLSNFGVAATMGHAIWMLSGTHRGPSGPWWWALAGALVAVTRWEHRVPSRSRSGQSRPSWSAGSAGPITCTGRQGWPTGPPW